MSKLGRPRQMTDRQQLTVSHQSRTSESELTGRFSDRATTSLVVSYYTGHFLPHAATTQHSHVTAAPRCCPPAAGVISCHHSHPLALASQALLHHTRCHKLPAFRVKLAPPAAAPGCLGGTWHTCHIASRATWMHPCWAKAGAKARTGAAAQCAAAPAQPAPRRSKQALACAPCCCHHAGGSQPCS